MRKIILVLTTILSLTASGGAQDDLTKAMQTASQLKPKRNLPRLDEAVESAHNMALYYLKVLDEPQSRTEEKIQSVQKLRELLLSDALTKNPELGERIINKLTKQLAAKEDALQIVALKTLTEIIQGIELNWYPEGGGQCWQGPKGRTVKILEEYCKIDLRILSMVRPNSGPSPQLSSPVKIAWIETAAALVPEQPLNHFLEGISKLSNDTDLSVKKTACDALEKLASAIPRRQGIRPCSKN